MDNKSLCFIAPSLEVVSWVQSIRCVIYIEAHM